MSKFSMLRSGKELQRMGSLSFPACAHWAECEQSRTCALSKLFFGGSYAPQVQSSALNRLNHLFDKYVYTCTTSDMVAFPMLFGKITASLWTNLWSILWLDGCPQNQFLASLFG